MTRRCFLVWAAACTLAASAGCVPDAPPRIQLGRHTAVPETSAIVFWADGVDVETFRALQRAGKLPNITRYLIDRGVTVRGAVASLPTITYANNVSFHTGLFPGHHGITGNKWFDRYSLVFQDYTSIKTYRQVDGDFTATTLYEALADEYTATILTPVRRGATRNIDNWASAGVAWWFGFQDTVNHLTTRRFELICDLANRTGRWPAFIMAYFVTPDTVGHKHGPRSPQYTDMVLDIDRQIGHVCQSLDKAGLLAKTHLTLISDHGFVETPHTIDVARYFSRTLKVPTVSKRFGRGVPFERRVAHFAGAKAVVVAGGNRRCGIHLRPGDHWWQRPTESQIDGFPHSQPPAGPGGPAKWPLPARLARLPAVDVLTVRLAAGAVRVHSAGGVGVIDRVVRDGRKQYRYRVRSGTDPLGHASDAQAAALMDGGYHDADAWLAATLASPKPDCVVQLMELSDSRRSGDITLFARDGWDFASGNKGGHGGLLRHEIIVPWVWAGPGLPAKSVITGARTVDLMPTILHLIGRSERVPAGLDGKSLADRLRRATPGR